jgi:hypothetical protein
VPSSSRIASVELDEFEFGRSVLYAQISGWLFVASACAEGETRTNLNVRNTHRDREHEHFWRGCRLDCGQLGAPVRAS